MLTVRVQLDVRVASRLHTGVSLLAGCGTRDLGKECTRGQINKGFGSAAKGFGTAIDVEAIGMSRSGDATECRDGGYRIDGGRHSAAGGMVKCSRGGRRGSIGSFYSQYE